MMGGLEMPVKSSQWKYFPVNGKNESLMFKMIQFASDSFLQ